MTTSAPQPAAKQRLSNAARLRPAIVQRKCACGGRCASCTSKTKQGEPSPYLQAKLKVGPPNDKYEREADQIADQVMRMPNPSVHDQVKEEEETLQKEPIANQITPLVQRQTEIHVPSIEVIQRQSDEEEEEQIQAKSMLNCEPRVTRETQDRISSLRGGGVSLSEQHRAFFEPRFGVDFGDVRIHDSPAAAATARRLKARAFTVGRDVFMGSRSDNSFDSRQLLAHELTHVIQQTQRPNYEWQGSSCHPLSNRSIQHQSHVMLRRVPSDNDEEKSSPKAHRVVVVCGLPGQGKKGTLTLETNEGPFPYGIAECVAGAGLYGNVPVEQNVHKHGEFEKLYFDITRGNLLKNVPDEPLDFSFDVPEKEFLKKDPRTFFDFSEEKGVRIEVAVNPHKLLFKELEGLSIEDAGLRISEIYNEVELEALRKWLDIKSYNAKDGAWLDAIRARVESQLGVAETQAERALVGDELGIDPEISERPEDHPELLSRLQKLHDALEFDIVWAEQHRGYLKRFLVDGEPDLLGQISVAKSRWRIAKRLTPSKEDREAADEARRLKSVIELLRLYAKFAISAEGVQSGDLKQFKIWTTLVRESLKEADSLSEFEFLALGARRLEIRNELEDHDRKVKSALHILETASVPKAGAVGAGAATKSHGLAGQLLRANFTPAEVRAALELLSEKDSDRFDLVMASGHLSWAILDLAQARGLSKEAAEAELSSLHSSGQGFLTGYSLRARELGDAGGLSINVSGDLSSKDIVASVAAMVDGIIDGLRAGLEGLGEGLFRLVELTAVGTERDKVIEDLIRFAKEALTNERSRFTAGAAMAELIDDQVKAFNKLNLKAQAQSIGQTLGQVAFEVLQDLFGGAAIGAVSRAARFTKMRAVLRLIRMTTSNALVKAAASGLVDLTGVVLKARRRAGKLLDTLRRSIPGFTSQSDFTRAVLKMEALDPLQRRVVVAAKEVGRLLDHMNDLATSRIDAKKWGRAVADLRSAERKLKLEISVYNKKAGSADALLARQSSSRPGNATQDELRAELEILYERLRVEKGPREVRLFPDSVHVYEKVDGCWERHSSRGSKGVCLIPPKSGKSIKKKAKKDAAALAAKSGQPRDPETGKFAPGNQGGGASGPGKVFESSNTKKVEGLGVFKEVRGQVRLQVLDADGRRTGSTYTADTYAVMNLGRGRRKFVFYDSKEGGVKVRSDIDQLHAMQNIEKNGFLVRPQKNHAAGDEFRPGDKIEFRIVTPDNVDKSMVGETLSKVLSKIGKKGE